MSKHTKPTETSERISFRLKQPLADRFSRVVIASRRTQTSIIDECLEDKLPNLEARYIRRKAA